MKDWQTDLLRIAVSIVAALGLLLGLFGCLSLLGAELEVIGWSTNRPAFDFTTGSPDARFHTSNFCYSITFRITGEPSTNVLRWRLDDPLGAYSTMWPDLYHTQAVTIVTYPLLTNTGSQFFLLKPK